MSIPIRNGTTPEEAVKIIAHGQYEQVYGRSRRMTWMSKRDMLALARAACVTAGIDWRIKGEAVDVEATPSPPLR